MTINDPQIIMELVFNRTYNLKYSALMILGT